MSDDIRRAPLHLRALDFVFILRPAALVPLWLFFFRGVSLATGGRMVVVPSARAITGLCSMTAALGGCYLLNQIRDIETDRLNDKLYFLPRGIVSVRSAWIELGVLWIGAALLAIPLSSEFAWLLAAAVALSWTYSAPPLSAKTVAPLDLIWNGLGFGLVGAAAGWACVAPLTSDVMLPAVSYALAVSGVIASTTILDVEGDRALGMRTTAAALGEKGTSLAAVALVVAGGVAGVAARDLVGVAGPLAALPLLIVAHVRGTRKLRVAANQFAVLAFVLAVGVGSPVILVLTAAVVLASRLYYRARFSVAYPGPGTS